MQRELRDIHLSISDVQRVEFSRELLSEFSFRARYPAYYLKRIIRKARFKVSNFTSIVVVGTQNPQPDRQFLFNNCLLVDAKFSDSTFRSLTPHSVAFHEYLLAMLHEGLSRSSSLAPGPVEALQRGIEDFRRGGYVTEWVHQQKTLKSQRILASLHCSIDEERFQLALRVERAGALVFDEVLLQTKPCELLFHWDFKDIKISADRLTVTKRSYKGVPPKGDLIQIPLKSL